MIAEKVIAHGMDNSRPPWLGVPCMVDPKFLVISDGPLTRLAFEYDRMMSTRDVVDLSRVKPASSKILSYHDAQLSACDADRLFK
jgi:hypothetical protein